ncbi:flavocytochrome c [Cetobacterium sp. 2A]|uniref:flavocytochrome c n=1 Tax=Cetobacterium sp. 2A TaxID=2754723 RepID=UPI00163C5D69|nr:flavocytochrome c [Cetobacterium sp. 2A]MBC2856517.1 flavocytochrome c [Cetobacterium sp. 2A]
MNKITTMLTAIMFFSTMVHATEFKAGTYLGTSDGYKGEIKVEVKLGKNKIEDIKIIKNGDTPIISDSALNILPSKILNLQGLGVDTVAGATGTSKGFISAVTKAIKSSGADTSELRKIKETKKQFSNKVINHENDVVIVGAGGAGLIAAIEAKLAGANVIIIEKMSFPGGNTLISGAEYAAPENWIQKKVGISDSKEQFYKDIIKGGDNQADINLIKVLADNALDGALWLRDFVNVSFEDRQMFFGGHSVERSLVPEGASGVELIGKLLKKAKDLNIPIVYNMNANELILDNTGKVIGVQAVSETETNKYLAKNGVILATGGFGSNLEMRMKYNTAMDENILSTNTTGITGDGIVMAEKIGAGVTDMEYIQTYPTCDPMTGALLYIGDVRLIGGSILVNKEGKRFVEELDRRDVISMAIKKQTGNVAYQFWNQEMMDLSKVAEHHSDEYNSLIKRKVLIKGNTIEEVAKAFDVDATELKNTVQKYNQYSKDGKDLEFNKRGKLTAFENGPFYLMKNVPAVHHTMGGLTIDTNARVLDNNKKPIPGLFAAGEVTGDIHGTNRLGSNAISDITVFGRVAGKNVVNN